MYSPIFTTTHKEHFKNTSAFDTLSSFGVEETTTPDEDDVSKALVFLNCPVCVVV